MNPSRIEQAIDEIYTYVENCKPSRMYPNKAIVERGELYDLLDELRMCAPEEIKRYQKIINNRDGILNEAQQRAEDMLSQAEQQTAQLLDQNEIVQAAYQRAEEIMKQATDEAQGIINAARQESEQMRHASLLYTSELLADAEIHIEETLREMDNKYRMMNSAMKNSIHVIKNNKEELAAQLNPKRESSLSPNISESKEEHSEGDGQEVDAAEAKSQGSAEPKGVVPPGRQPIRDNKDDFEVPESSFLKNVEK